jgi:N-acetylglucosamine-6-sulfatase
MTGHQAFPLSYPVILAATLLSAVAAASTAYAQCTTLSESAAVARSLRRATNCNYRILRSGPGVTCPDATPPACAGNLVNDTAALTYGLNNPPASAVDKAALRTQLYCQLRIGRAAAGFIGRKLRLLIRGYTPAEAEAKARRYVDQIPKRCMVAVAQDQSGVVVPAVGPPCDASVGSAGHQVDGDALRACLLPALEVGVDRSATIIVPKPNLVIILTDDQRWDTTGLEHSIDGMTPVMPEVQAELAGVTFPNAFVSTSLCCPSRSSLLRGQYAHTTGVLTNTQPLGGALNFDDSSTLATWLQGAGYHTGFFGKYLNGYNQLWTAPAPPYVPPGWEEWHAFKAPKYYDFSLIEHGAGYDHADTSYDSGCATYTTCPGDAGPCSNLQNYSTDVLLAKALTFVDQAAGQPFFLYFAPYAPHAPACAAEQDAGSFGGIAPWRPPNWNEADVSDKPAWVQNLCPMPSGKQNNIDNFRKKQLASLQAVDRAVGAIMDKLRAIGQDQNTLVLFTSDNGYAWGAHCHRPKRCPYEECLRVPLFIRYPALVPSPRVDLRAGLNIDFAFTFAELAGLMPPITQDGRSLTRVLTNDEAFWRPDFLYEQWLDPDDEDNDVVPPTLAAVRSTEWKYVEYVTGETELYNLLADPFELQNETLNPAYVDLKAQLAARLQQLRPGWPPP